MYVFQFLIILCAVLGGIYLILDLFLPLVRGQEIFTMFAKKSEETEKNEETKETETEKNEDKKNTK